MDAVTCGRILDEVREIMIVTDWHLFDKTVAEKAGTSEIGLHLQNIVENYESFLSVKLQNTIDTIDDEQAQQKECYVKSNPMPLLQF